MSCMAQSQILFGIVSHLCKCCMKCTYFVFLTIGSHYLCRQETFKGCLMPCMAQSQMLFYRILELHTIEHHSRTQSKFYKTFFPTLQLLCFLSTYPKCHLINTIIFFMSYFFSVDFYELHVLVGWKESPSHR